MTKNSQIEVTVAAADSEIDADEVGQPSKKS
jgi:hypothetical protein